MNTVSVTDLDISYILMHCCYVCLCAFSWQCIMGGHINLPRPKTKPLHIGGSTGSCFGQQKNAQVVPPMNEIGISAH